MKLPGNVTDCPDDRHRRLAHLPCSLTADLHDPARNVPLRHSHVPHERGLSINSMRIFLLGLLCATLPTGTHALSQAADSAVTRTDCRLHSEQAMLSTQARCAWLNVPEDRARPEGRQIRLHIAIIPALRLKPLADPLYIISGGPGQAASELYLSMAPAFARVRRDRDIVVVDQRGTGRSHRLDCVFPEEQPAHIDAPALQQATRTCIDSLPADVRFYTTSVAVQDLDTVRAALGHEQLNLYGISYGTRVAQHYMRRHPQRVRSVILDGVVPPDLPLGPQIATDAQAALDHAFERCDATPDCAAAFPDLATSFQALQTRLQTRSWPLEVADPLTGRPTALTFGLSQLAAAVRLLSYTDETLSLLPLLIHQAQVEQRPQALAAQYLIIARSTATQLATGMHFAVACSEDAPRWQVTPAARAAQTHTYLGEVFMDSMQAICEPWPVGLVDDDFHAPLHSTLPVLVLSGDNDPVTPPANGERILHGLPNARHLIIPGQGHGQLAIGCVTSLASQFITAGSAATLDTSCIDTITPTAFMLSTTGSAP